MQVQQATQMRDSSRATGWPDLLQTNAASDDLLLKIDGWIHPA